LITRILSPFQCVPGISRAAVGAAALAGALAFAPAPVQAQTLAEALIAAYSNNPTLAARRARLRATDEQVPQALSNWRPSVAITGDAGYERNRSTLRTTDRTQNRNPATVGLSITQPLYRGGRTLAATEGAENAVRAERARLIDTEQDILLAAATAYLNVFRDEAVLALNINNEKVLKRQLEATKDRFEVGEITRTDVHQAEARLAGATADRIRAEANLENSRATYENVVGLPAPKNLELAGPCRTDPQHRSGPSRRHRGCDQRLGEPADGACPRGVVQRPDRSQRGRLGRGRARGRRGITHGSGRFGRGTGASGFPRRSYGGPAG